MSKNCLLISVLILLTACVTRPPQPEVIEEFRTEIDEENAKYFFYSLEFTYSDEELAQLKEYGEIIAENSAGRRSIRSLGQVVDRRMRTVLNGKGYCKAGFVEIERNIGKRLGSISGECRDKATEEDKKRFGNKENEEAQGLSQ